MPNGVAKKNGRASGGAATAGEPTVVGLAFACRVASAGRLLQLVDSDAELRALVREGLLLGPSVFPSAAGRTFRVALGADAVRLPANGVTNSAALEWFGEPAI